MGNVDFYKTLQIARHAEPEVVERAYKALSMKYHPDKVESAERERATRRMQQINEAYQTLRDAEKRRRYDRTLPTDASGDAWDRFWERGLLGLFLDRYLPR
ncbi:MAG: DnaJ domain-containing protein [Coriobacteriia bacterium]|nr:DnaJ domain-containing protein [Coriobacteriia bacterium]